MIIAPFDLVVCAGVLSGSTPSISLRVVFAAALLFSPVLTHCRNHRGSEM
jgi:hypothetical protein